MAGIRVYQAVEGDWRVVHVLSGTKRQGFASEAEAIEAGKALALLQYKHGTNNHPGFWYTPDLPSELRRDDRE